MKFWILGSWVLGSWVLVEAGYRVQVARYFFLYYSFAGRFILLG